MTKKDKTTISSLLFSQAYDCLELGIIARKELEFYKEIQLSINIQLLLGVFLEGLVNEIGPRLIDSSTWNDLEMVSTPLKWKILLGIDSNTFNYGNEPLQSIRDLHKQRNRIVHPKLSEFNKDWILVNPNGEIILDPSDDYKMTNGVQVYEGVRNYISEFNISKSLKSMKRVLLALEIIVEHNKLEGFTWYKERLRRLNEIDSDKLIIKEFHH